MVMARIVDWTFLDDSQKTPLQRSVELGGYCVGTWIDAQPNMWLTAVGDNLQGNGSYDSGIFWREMRAFFALVEICIEYHANAPNEEATTIIHYELSRGKH